MPFAVTLGVILDAAEGGEVRGRFFRELGHQTPQPITNAPTALGSANRRPTGAGAGAASMPSRARAHEKRTSPTRPARSDEARRTTIPRITALAVGGVVFLLIAGLAIANLGSSPTPHATLASTSTSTTPLEIADTLASTLAAITVPANHLAGPRQPSTRRPRAHKAGRRHLRRQLHTVPVHVAARASAPTATYPSTSASSGTGSSSSSSTPSGTAGTASGGSDSTRPAEHSTSPSPTSQPAFGANGTLGPGSSPNG